MAAQKRAGTLSNVPLEQRAVEMAERGGRDDAGIVDESEHRVRPGDLVEPFPRSIGIRQVDLVECPVEALRRTPRDADDVMALVRHACGDGLADAAAGAGDQD